ncbi:hypothetical protein JHK87_001730 [Glycine soja]|nr:hypothetical protein JHK87_001730 [Glycine soja]
MATMMWSLERSDWDLVEATFIHFQVALDKNKPRIQTVVNKIDIIQNEYKTMQLEVLAGNHSLVTTVVENGIRFARKKDQMEDVKHKNICIPVTVLNQGNLDSGKFSFISTYEVYSDRTLVMLDTN